MLGPARAPRALAFPDVGECTVMAAHFVDDPLDPVDRWSVLWLSKYLGQCSYWPKGWLNAKSPEDAAHAIGHTLQIFFATHTVLKIGEYHSDILQF